MSTGEFVVIQVRLERVSADGARSASGLGWMDYSRCTPREARLFLSDKDAAKYRPVHWIDKTELSRSQMDAMISDTVGKYADKAPAYVAPVELVEITRGEASALGEVLYNALSESEPSQWSDWDGMVATLRKIASPFILGLWDERH